MYGTLNYKHFMLKFTPKTPLIIFIRFIISFYCKTHCLIFVIVDTGEDPLEDLKTDDSIPDFDDDNNMEYEFKGILDFLEIDNVLLIFGSLIL